MKIINAERTNTQGGSIRVHIVKNVNKSNKNRSFALLNRISKFLKNKFKLIKCKF